MQIMKQSGCGLQCMYIYLITRPFQLGQKGFMASGVPGTNHHMTSWSPPPAWSMTNLFLRPCQHSQKMPCVVGNRVAVVEVWGLRHRNFNLYCDTRKDCAAKCAYLDNELASTKGQRHIYGERRKLNAFMFPARKYKIYLSYCSVE